MSITVSSSLNYKAHLKRNLTNWQNSEKKKYVTIFA